MVDRSYKMPTELDQGERRYTFQTPLGDLTVAQKNGSITRMRWKKGASTAANAKTDDPLFQAAETQVREYFAKERQEFDLPLAPDGTEFQKAVWRALYRIPFGITKTYGDIADEVGGHARAVGVACGANPIPLVIPCHRVMGANGRMTGFSASGGIEDKVALLQIESGVLL